ncbi:trypsin [Trichuris suis]|nr:trypsin [Trichuris suis]
MANAFDRNTTARFVASECFINSFPRFVLLMNLGQVNWRIMKAFLAFHFLVILFTVFKAEGRSPERKSYPCGVAAFKHTLKRRREDRIANGWEAKRNSLPWIVAIFYKEDKVLKVCCGGSTINAEKSNQSSLVLTAAHCFVTESKVFDKAKKYFVAAGLHDIREQSSSTTQRVQVKGYLHLDYDADVMQNDVAIVILEKPLRFTDSVRPICLPKSSDPSVPLSGCYIAGWGIMNGEN